MHQGVLRTPRYSRTDFVISSGARDLHFAAKCRSLASLEITFGRMPGHQDVMLPVTPLQPRKMQSLKRIGKAAALSILQCGFLSDRRLRLRQSHELQEFVPQRAK